MAIVCWNVTNYFLNIGNKSNGYIGQNQAKLAFKCHDFLKNRFKKDSW